MSIRPICLVAVLVVLAAGALPVRGEEPWSIPCSEADVVVRSGRRTHRFRVEVARTPEQRARGLMGRELLPEGAGMLFVFQEPKIARMWMKNTLIPLDMLFLAPEGTVLQIAEGVAPLSTATVSSDRPVKAVLEVRGGTARRLGIEPGDQVVEPALGGTE